MDLDGYGSALRRGNCANCSAAIVEGSRFCHACGMPLTGQRPTDVVGRMFRVARRFSVISIVGYIAAWGMLAGGVFGAAGVAGLLAAVAATAQILAGWRAGLVSAVSLGLGYIGIYALLVLLVVAGDMGGEPEALVLIGAGYLVVAVPTTIRICSRPPPPASPWVCGECGYLLVGLTGPRCPECGTKFGAKRSAGRSVSSDAG